MNHLVATLMVAMSLQAPPPGFDQSNAGPEVLTGNERVHVGFVRVEDSWLPATDRPSGGSGSGGGAGECRLWVAIVPPLEAIAGLDGPVEEGSVPVRVRCGSAFVEDRWVSPADVVDVDGWVWAEAQRHVETVLAPGLELGTSPPANILVGLSTWFWLGGWDGAPISVTVSAPWGESVDLELWLVGVRWDFGDGSPAVVGDLGRPYPAESSVQHVYEVRSTSRAEPDGAYVVSATVGVGVRYWYGGGGPFEVSPLELVHEADVVVRQLQAVLR